MGAKSVFCEVLTKILHMVYVTFSLKIFKKYLPNTLVRVQ
jgi:hypothetical protein